MIREAKAAGHSPAEKETVVKTSTAARKFQPLLG